MGTLTRKQREIAAREELILTTAAQMLVERGYLGVTMDRIAAATEYSKGTIYQHFPNKEEIVAALAIESSTRRVALFERAATFPGRTRERMAAIGVAADLFVRMHPLHFQCEAVIGSHSIRQKAAPESIQRLEDGEWGCMNVVLGVIRDAVAQGDLVLDVEDRSQEIVLGLWSMTTGFHQMTAAPDCPIQRKLGLEDLGASLFQCYDRFLDGYGWLPLSGDWDYPAVLERIRSEVFADELKSLARS